MIEKTRRHLFTLLGLLSIFRPRIGVAGGLPVPPCSFPFDASRKGVSLREKFIVHTKRSYMVALIFSHNGGEEARKLAAIVDANKALFTSESVRRGQPIRVTRDYFMEKKTFSSRLEKKEALAIADQKLRDATHAAIRSEFTNEETEFVYLAQNTNGIIPITIELTKIEDEKITSVIKRKKLDSNDTSFGGNGQLIRIVTGAVLSPGLYEVYVETVRDSPLLFDVPMKLSITYRPKI